MFYLIIVTILWAFSFSLIGEYLAGSVDSYFAVVTRISLAALVFLPITQWRGIAKPFIKGVMICGALQFGITYVCLYLSFSMLTVPEVLLFTILTPLHITLIDDLLNRRFQPWALLAALIAVFGAGIIRYDAISPNFLVGFLLLQIANFTFAAGQVYYKFLINHYPSTVPQYKRWGYFYIGGFFVAFPAFLLLGNAATIPQITLEQWSILAWLGFAASALGMYWWNKGACQVDAGTLGIMNNALIPAGLIVNIVIWNHNADLLRLILGGIIIASSLWINKLGRNRTL
ncbi:carboxylate/amino acid/amine transporter [Entomomonas sp. E2T0]|uniref:carboxylate/amino acid/amine transporter n=1 Tax=Entomomonas sp. E2T0 TaxID=2930213 RepID=UPI00222851D9|nr:carboxylate/amino acid/amine transporter [Entomomonas sp. E2T0]UYZ83163.1 carboxylate/amino acid/amine transporter [Entomomonas sp. E2T0]